MEYFNSAYLIGRIHHVSPYIDDVTPLYEINLITDLPSGDPCYVAIYFPYSKTARILESFHEGDMVEITGCIRPDKESSQILHGYSIHHVNDENFGDYDRSEKSIIYLSGSISSVVPKEDNSQEIHLHSFYDNSGEVIPFDSCFITKTTSHEFNLELYKDTEIFVTGHICSSSIKPEALTVFADQISIIPSK